MPIWSCLFNAVGIILGQLQGLALLHLLATNVSKGILMDPREEINNLALWYSYNRIWTNM